MILLPPDGPSPTTQHAPYYLPPPGPPPVHSQAPVHGALISPEDDVQRLFNVCKVGRGNAELLQEVLVYAKPQELKNDITKELVGRARASHELIGSQIPWATTEAEKSRHVARSIAQTTQEQLLESLLAAHGDLTECLKMYEDLERIAIEQEAEERRKTERLIEALTAVAEYEASTEETPLIEWVFSTGDSERTGKINPQTATRIFSASNLPPDALARIWEIASVDSKDGLLDRQGVGVALRLIGHAQKGAVVTESLVKRPGPLAVLENISPVPSEPVAGPSSGMILGALPPLTMHDKAKFKKIFKASGAQNGVLPGQQAREVFMKSKLPRETLQQIWALADVHRRGLLDLPDFTIAMYLIQALMTGKISTVPTSLPPHVYDEAGRRSPQPVSTPNHVNLPPAPPLHPLRSTAPVAASPFADPPMRTPTTSPFADPPPRHPSSRNTPTSTSQANFLGWEISPATKVQADHVFSTLDPRNKGRVKGEAVREYIRQVGLSSNAIGRIWDLVDIGRKGYLNRDEFTMAMHLVKMRKDGQHLPHSLPPGLLAGPPAEEHHDAYTGIVADAPQHLQPTSQLTSLHASSYSEDRSRLSVASAGPSNLRSSRSSPHLSTLASLQPIATPLPAPSTPFPMSPLPPGVMTYVPSQPTNIEQWNLKPEERARYDRYFDQLDTQRKGYLLSDVAVPFFARAKLPNDVMATIWDMADSEHDGQLTREDFAVAMHLIRQKLAGAELPTPIPALTSSPTASSSRPGSTATPPRRVSMPNQGDSLSRRTSVGSQPAQPIVQPAPVTPPIQLDPTTVRLPDDVDDGIRSDTPPPPYELIASDAT
ncbi:EF-hand protein [Dichomitus squalens]|uniref:EF-hand protein n=1 Tax=Dichomitus squalens TaxID=114155 RepID=A0A4Q9MP46_9APHY|nr:EF-hand protein [Dichomitus squalens]